MSEVEKIPMFFVYAGMRQSRTYAYYQYYIIEKLEQKDIIHLESEMRSWTVKEKLYARPSVGAVYPAKLDAETKTTVSYNEKSLPVGYVQNEPLVAKWHAEDLGAKGVVKIKNEATKNKLIESLQPARNAYRNGSIEEKRAILAEVLRVITS